VIKKIQNNIKLNPAGPSPAGFFIYLNPLLKKEGMTTLHQRIPTSGIKRITSYNSFTSEPETLQGSVFLNGRNGVFRTGRPKTASAGTAEMAHYSMIGGKGFLIKFY
jgi:hypothetical protein